MNDDGTEFARWRQRLHEIIFEADTPLGKAFDVGLFICIVLSVLAVVLESETAFRMRWGTALRVAEWVFTILFTIEYGLRLVTVRKPWKYAISFYGAIDLLAILPTYISLFVVGTHSLIVIRALRLLRVFRVFKLAHFLGEAQVLRSALQGASTKIMVFLGTILPLVLILGTAMYLIEGEEHGFDSIPRSIYWAIVTMTTVGYGDITPHTVPGRFLACFVMILGYGIIAVPTGIVTAEIAFAARREKVSTQACPTCSAEGHDNDAKHCKWCGAEL